jgi:hypothetical protein
MSEQDSMINNHRHCHCHIFRQEDRYPTQELRFMISMTEETITDMIRQVFGLEGNQRYVHKSQYTVTNYHLHGLCSL